MEGHGDQFFSKELGLLKGLVEGAKRCAQRLAVVVGGHRFGLRFFVGPEGGNGLLATAPRPLDVSTVAVGLAID